MMTTVAALLFFAFVTTVSAADTIPDASDFSGGIMTDRPSAEPLPPLEYPPAKRPPGFTLPPARPDHPDTAPVTPLRLTVQQFRFRGNTVFTDAELQAIAASYRQRPLTTADLETLRLALTQHYIQHGYTNSGALLPGQTLTDGSLYFQIIEGQLSDIQVKGTGWLHPEYVQNRLERGTGPPLNTQDLQERFQLLLSDPLIERMDGRLMPGHAPGESVLDVQVTRARPYQLALSLDNYNPPSIGAEAVRLDGWVRNLSGFGDWLGVSLGLTEGHFNVDTRLTMPLNRYDTLLTLRFADSHASVIEGALNQVKIRNDFRSYDLTLSQPVYRTLRHHWSLGLRLSVRRSRNTLLGREFPLAAGEENSGVSRVSALRLTQEYIGHQPRQLLSFRSTFSIGVHAFDATWHDDGQPDGDFLAWLGQLQYARRILDNGAQIRFRGNVQLTPDQLLPLERFAVGGVYSVRGYRENEQVRDMGYTLSVELQYPLLNGKHIEHFPGVLNVIPFMDYGAAWDQSASQKRASLHSIGLGLNWLYQHLNAEFFYAHDLNSAGHRQTYDLQDSGVHFRLTAALF